MQVSQSDSVESRTSRKHTTITDLPVELLLMIFDRFNLEDLNGVAKMHPYTHHVASSVFKQKFTGESHLINKDGLFVKREENQSMMELGNRDVMYLAIKMFGHFISNLTIDYYLLGEWESGIINGRISKYLGNSLTELTITNYLQREAHLKYLGGPFKKVETVYFSKCSLGRHQQNLSRVFPVLRKLHFLKTNLISESTINHHFPYLIEFNELSSFSSYKKLDTFIQLNPQLRTLAIDKIDWSCFKLMSETQRNLEHFELQELWGDTFEKNEELHFNHLKTFKIIKMNRFSYDVDLPLVFGNDIVEIFDWTTDKNLIKYILRSKSLKKLNIGALGRKDLQRIAEEIEGLEELTLFYIDSNEAMDVVVRFIETAKQLKKITLMQCSQQFHNDIHEKIQNKWEIKHEASFEITFIKQEQEL